MPGIDGFEATARIRRHEESSARRRTPIVALTANAMSGDRERFIAAGFDGYLGKPFTMQALIEAIETAIAPPLAVTTSRTRAFSTCGQM